MKIVRENLWSDPRRGGLGLIAVTTNAGIRRNGTLVMGRGAALEATQRIPGIELEAGKKVQRFIDHWFYGFLVVRRPKPAKVGFGLFQVKYSWRKPAELDLIERSAKMLARYANENPDTQIRVNYPGIGNGRLKRADVEPLLEVLPDNVTICYK